LTAPGRPALQADLVVLEPGGPFDAELRFRVPGDVAAIDPAVQLVLQHVVPRYVDRRAAEFNLRVAVAEALANAIVYGCRSDATQHVEVRVSVGARAIEAEISDPGPGFDPDALPDPTAPEGVGRPDGRGVFLIRHLVDAARYNDKGNSVRLSLRSRTGRVDAMVAALATLHGGPVRLWHVRGALDPVLVAGPPAHDAPRLEPIGPGHRVALAQGEAWVEPVQGHPGHWLSFGPPPQADAGGGPRAAAAAQLAGEALLAEREASAIASELATRYEEIDLLYTIAEVLGRTVRLEEAAQTIAHELADVAGARRASILLHDEATDTLQMVAARGLELYRVTPVEVRDPHSIAARVFREQTMLSHDGASTRAHPGHGPERGYRGASFVSLPITYAPPGGVARPIGVINLTDRIGDDAFTAGHKRLLAAVAAQVGAAIENARLVERERRRVRLDTELALAHGLQTALMPTPTLLRQLGDLAARTAPVDSVGGDFYKALRIGRDGVGVMLGDVSSHGLTAAMLMAHAIAASGIAAQIARTPQQALERLLEVVGDELLRAEMHLSLFYGVIDSRRGRLLYANAGHPQAFLVPGDDSPPRRLVATAPPLGLASDRRIAGAEVPWRARSDILCLFSDGISEALGPGGEPFGEERLLATVRRMRSEPTAEIVPAVFAELAAFAPGPAGDDRTLVLARR
jgi:sigma-B regulation protein RsbU (phosphoserine phosphatase)